MDYQDFHKKVKEVTDEELDEILRHVNEELKKRQDKKYDKESMENMITENGNSI